MAGEATERPSTDDQSKVYTEEEKPIIARMDEAAKEDRDRFFVVADAMGFQPKYKARADELEAVKQQWRDMTALPNYPEIDWPMTLPTWFPLIKFASRWGTDYLANTLERNARASERLPDRQAGEYEHPA